MSSNSELHVKSGEVNAKRNSHEAIAVNDVRINIKENNNNGEAKVDSNEKINEVDVQKNGKQNEQIEMLGEFELYDNNTIQEYKALLNNFESFTSLSGLFAGFEGFIINDYTGQSPSDVNIIIQWGIFLLMISLTLNVFVSVLSLVSSQFIRWGLLRRYFVQISMMCMVLAAFATFLFVIAFNLYISQGAIWDGAKVFIYLLTSIVTVAFLVLFLFLSVSQMKEDRETKVKLMDKVL